VTAPQVELTVHIAAPPEAVWELWTVPERICEWWGIKAQLDPTPGGIMRVTLAVGGVMAGRYVELDQPHRLVFRFGWEATPGAPAVSPESSTVEVLLEAHEDGTLLTLRHYGLPVGEPEVQHRDGWTHFLVGLADAVRTEKKR
jgi:uncharacterized protein YndB with AHSA1/START domain